MKVLMIGWEYPPHIAGGLGTACEGLTYGLARQGVDIRFVLPRVAGDEDARHMELVSPSQNPPAESVFVPYEGAPAKTIDWTGIPAFLMPYWTEEEYASRRKALTERTQALRGGERVAAVAVESTARPVSSPQEETPHLQYGHDIFEEVLNFAQRTIWSVHNEDFDIIHAHDWMTFPAAVALHELTGKPLVVHVHSLEYDRSGNHGNNRINDFEHYGVTAADAVIAVSHYTKQLICRIHGVPEDKVFVVHNGIYPTRVLKHYHAKHPDWPKHMVLFLGRVTFQKGPDYFVRAAAKVIPHVPDVLFVLAGSGDMLDRVKHLAHELNIEDHFYFPGFLRGKAVEEIYSVADLYVMPSVSEPFGISALEAINFQVPAIISRQSGVAEVLTHSLKFDFWDVDRLADLVINGLLHEEMRSDMIEMAKDQLMHLKWDASATKTIDVYQQLVH